MFLIYKFTDGKAGCGLCVRRQGNNVGRESFSQTKATGSMSLTMLEGFFLLVSSPNKRKSRHISPLNDLIMTKKTDGVVFTN